MPSSQVQNRSLLFFLKAALIFSGSPLLGILGGISLASQFEALRQIFLEKKAWPITRFYSDVSRLSLGQPAAVLRDHLKRRGLSFQEAPPTADAVFPVTFECPPANYPLSLLPSDSLQKHFFQTHPEKTMPVTVFIQQGVLKEILLDQQAVSEFFLEPELLSTQTAPQTPLRTFLPLEEVPAPLWKAIVAIEDPHFLSHRGFHLRGFLRAVWVNLRTRSFAQGGSTLTQQLVKNLRIRRSKNLFAKAQELLLTFLLEAFFSKERILERYLNEVYLGQLGSIEVRGVEEGARWFFQKPLSQLNIAEMALLAGLIRGPAFYSPYQHWNRALERQKLILKKMVETGQIAPEEGEESLREPIRLAPPPQVSTQAPFFVDYAKWELETFLQSPLTQGLQVYTTLNLDLQKEAQQTLLEHLSGVDQPTPERLEGAFASTHPKTGKILALVGGRNYRESQFNRILNMRRQVGSLFKPLVYLTAFQQKRDAAGKPYGGGTLLADTPVSWNGWQPRNADRRTRGWIPLSQALTHSLNLPTVRLAHAVGLKALQETARALGIQGDLPSVPSLALGVAELSPLEILQAYAAFASAGSVPRLFSVQTTVPPLPFFPSLPRPPLSHFFDLEALDLLQELLQSGLEEGTAKTTRALGFHFPGAGKTGTTNDSRDAWFAGYTPEIASVVWVGLDRLPQKTVLTRKLRLSGAQTALPIWVTAMNRFSVWDPLFFVSFPPSSRLVILPTDLNSGERATADCSAFQWRDQVWMASAMPEQETCEATPPPLPPVPEVLPP